MDDTLMWGSVTNASFSVNDPYYISRQYLRRQTEDKLLQLADNPRLPKLTKQTTLALISDEMTRRSHVRSLKPADLLRLYGGHNVFSEQTALERIELLTEIIERREADDDLFGGNDFSDWLVPTHEEVDRDLRFAHKMKFPRAEIALAGLRLTLEYNEIIRQSEARDLGLDEEYET